MRRQSGLVAVHAAFRDKSPRLANAKQFTHVNKGKKYPYNSTKRGHKPKGN